MSESPRVDMEAPLSYTFPPYRLVPSRRLLLSGDTQMRLGGRAFEMLVVLVERRDRTVSKHELMDLVWPRLVVEENNLQVQVLALRKLLGHAAIATVPGRGYQFTLRVTMDGCDSEAGPKQSSDNQRGSARSPTNLPHWLPPLLGREPEFGSLLQLMDRHAWVTVAGPAGIGKTRLAQGAASAKLQNTAGGVWWVDLAPLVDPALIAHAVALAMGLQPASVVDQTAAIAASIGPQPTLIVLDNAEHLLDGVARLVSQLRPMASQLRLLVTSQEILHVAEEHVFRVGPLSLPADDSLAAVLASGAASLFIARAQAVDRNFALAADNCTALADICRRLDGIPLAIELAAARVALLGVEGLRTRLDQRFQVLTSGDRTALRRHRTLRDALEWSYQLLSEAERSVFRRLGVFAGGFTLDAAQAVAEDDRGIDRWDVLEHLGALVDKSLVVAEGDPIPRYRLLETMRLFALERLMERDEVEAVRTAHRDHYLQVVEDARVQAQSASPNGLPMFDVERDNLFVALAWTRGDDDGSRGLRLAESMRPYWTSRGLVARGLESLRAALSHPGIRSASVPRCRAEAAAAAFCCLMSRFDEGLDHASRAVAQARDLGDDAWLSVALTALGAVLVRQGDSAEAERCAGEAVPLARASGDSDKLAFALSLLSAVYYWTGHYNEAREVEEEVMALSRETNDLRSQAMCHLNLGFIATELGRLDETRQHMAAVLEMLRRVDSEFHGAYLIRMAAGWAAVVDRGADAVTLRAAYDAHSLRIGLNTPFERAEASRVQKACDGLDVQTRAASDATGRALPYHQALELVARMLETAAPATGR